MAISQYLDIINQRYQTGISREHSYRGDLQNLLQELLPNDVLVTNEPARYKFGAPDYVLTKKDIPVGFIEAKDIGDSDLPGKKKNKEQFNRYKDSLGNLIFTDYLDFHLYIDGEFTTSIKLADIENGKVNPIPANFEQFKSLIQDFATHIGQTIRSPLKLSKMMAGKAKMLAQVIEKALTSDEENQENSTLFGQMEAFKRILIHDINPKEFADIYAQTIAYGMFAARLHDETLQDFSRHEAASLIPKSNPFLRNLFQYISGYDIDIRIEWIVSSLADIFRATDVKSLLTNFGKATQQNDPIIHFYETFLAEYDPKLRKSRGVWYTPEPVVNFIVRAVDDILKTEFGLPRGLADNSKIKIKKTVKTKATADRRSKLKETEIEEEVHRVQILDPATGTGTFLAEVVKHIYNSQFKAMQGAWSGYVEKDLIPRLNGFELLMASYAMAHLKMDLLLTDTGYKSKTNQRFKIYLTNSLEESHPDTGTLFANWLSNEASEANHIKRETPVMCVIGNPPYSSSSSNKGKWIKNLINIYKKNLNERKINLDDDYIKFIRYGQYLIDKNGEGILIYISNNSFIDGITHRQMRKNLLQSFDKIYILDLHGNSKKKEVSPDGSIDQNVFDIMQGVSINLFIKSGKKDNEELGKCFHYDIFGRRELKYDILHKMSIKNIEWSVIDFRAPSFFFKPFDYELKERYSSGFKITEIFLNYNSGLHSKRDSLVFNDTIQETELLIDYFIKNEIKEIRDFFSLPKDGRDWKVNLAKKDLSSGYKIIKTQYRLFDEKYMPYTGRSKGIVAYPRTTTTKHFLEDNIGIVFKRTGRIYGTHYDFIFLSSNMISEGLFAIDPLGREYIAPLYCYPENEQQQNLLVSNNRLPNLNQKIVEEISQKISQKFSQEKINSLNSFSPIDILDYIYAVLYSPRYRKRYVEFLKIDFPRVPYPKDQETFWKLVKLGGELREIHLLESPKIENYITTYPADGDNVITRKLTKNSPGFELTDKENNLGKVWINDEQYFDKVPLIAWEFYIGGYQPAQKWLKDRTGRELSFDDILHYQKIIVALTETDRIMKEIDLVGVE